jgi:hypothetical protein
MTESAHPPVEPLWTGPAWKLRSVVGWETSNEAEVAVVPWPLPAPPAERNVLAEFVKAAKELKTATFHNNVDSTLATQRRLRKAQIRVWACTDIAEALLSGQATEEETDG